MAKRFIYRFYTDFTLFGSVKRTKNFDLDKYKHRGYDIELDSHSEFKMIVILLMLTIF